MVSLEEAFVTLGIDPERIIQEEKPYEIVGQSQAIPESFLRGKTNDISLLTDALQREPQLSKTNSVLLY